MIETIRTRAIHPVTLAALTYLGLLNLVRGGLHVFLPDSGAHSIAGLDISGAPQPIIFFLASVGLSQMGMGVLDLWAVLRNRALVMPLLVVQTGLFWAVSVLMVVKPLPILVPGNVGAGVNMLLFTGILVHEFWRGRRG